MNRHAWAWPVGLLSLLLLPGAARLDGRADDQAAPKAPVRKLLYPADEAKVPKALRPFVARLRGEPAEAGQPDNGTAAGVFVRVIPRRYVLDGGNLKDGAWLGTRPFVFLTRPESLYGKSLLDVFSRIGYSADHVLTGQIDVEAVVVVFRYNEKVRLHTDRTGTLPDDWRSAAYPATWDNLIALVEKLAEGSETHVIEKKRAHFAPSKLSLRSARERLFVLGFPDAGKERVKQAPYQVLRATGGADWAYRRILERTMGAAEHYTGNGTCKPTFLRPGQKVKPAVEFLGPNSELKALEEIAVVGLGRLKVSE
jgi:hypothetical protein